MPPATHVDLLIGHNLLQDSLSGEDGLGMLHPDGTFSARFLLLQAQATRMISVIAEQTANSR